MLWHLIKYIFVSLYVSALMAGEALYLRLPDKKLKEVKILEIKEMQVTSACAQNAKSCIDLIESKSNLQKNIKRTEPFLGHPASAFCLSIGGKNLILEDEKLNQYDFCFFENNYGIDSWQLYKKYKK